MKNLDTMKILKISVLIVLGTLIYLAFVGFALHRMDTSDERYITRYDTDLSKFDPFKELCTLKTCETSLKIMDNYPKIYAASAFYPLAATLVHNLYDSKYYDSSYLSMVSTDEGFNAIINGDCDIYIVTEPSEEQREKIVLSEADLEFVPICKEKLEVLVNINNPVKDISIDSLKAIYEGKISTWNDVEGYIIGKGEEEIHTYSLEKNNGSRTCFDNVVANPLIDENCHFKADSMNNIITSVGKDKNGICYAFDSYNRVMYYDFRTKNLKVNGKSLEDKDYPLQYDVYLVYNKKSINSNTLELVEYLQSKEGKELIQEIRGV